MVASSKYQDQRLTQSFLGTVTAINPPPKQLVCGAQGILLGPKLQILSTSVGENVNQCVAACKTVDTCVSFSFDASLKLCNFYNAPIKSQNFQATSIGLEYSNEGCKSFDNEKIMSVTDSS